MINGIQTNEESAKATINILPKFCDFDNAFTYTAVSGGENAIVDNNAFITYYGDRDMLLTFQDTNEIVFSSGATEMDTLIKEDGQHILSYAFNKDDNNAVITFTIECFVNGVLQTYNTITQVLDSTSGWINDQWNTYWQEMSFLEDEVVSYRFRAQCDTVGTKLAFGRMMMELKDRGQVQPTIYTPPHLVSIKSKHTLDVPSIANGATNTQTVTIQGAKVGFACRVIVPIEFATLGLVVPDPIVTAEGEVKMIIYNNSGGAINPASGEYTFLINEV